ncbi:hypothetical protein AB1Y20_019114 [Prymnesium parvum]|uniref:Fe2OG dioxygenase domain-containing protein n=1 Tax=Prymnesium parvum TaxID=97485 RepID=A0AB34JU90_PRYPA
MMLRRARRRLCSLCWKPSPLAPNVWSATVAKAWQSDSVRGGARVLWAQTLLPPQVHQAMRALLPSLRFDRDADSVDASPSFEVRWVRGGVYTHAPLASIFRATVEQRLLPLLRRSDLAAGHDLVLCEALVRVYDDGARRVHPAHYDADALVTAVVEIDSSPQEDGSRGYEGAGFYVQPGAHVSSRIPLAIAPGDVVAHSFDLQHGVQVARGRRLSVVFWFTDSLDSCKDKSRPWYRAAAALGDADGQYNLGKGIGHENPKEALNLLRAAAQQGHFVAQNDVGVMLMHGSGCEGGVPQMEEAEKWLQASAAQGFHRAMVSMAFLCAQRGNETQALEWLRGAAEQRADPEVMYSLGLTYLHGKLSAERDEEIALKWLEESAIMGHPRAQLAMSKLAKDAEEAETWLLRAAEQSQPGAVTALAMLYGSNLRFMELLSFLARCTKNMVHVSSKWTWS